MHRTYEAIFFERAPAARWALSVANSQREIASILRAVGAAGVVGTPAEVCILRALRGDDCLGPEGPVEDFAYFARACIKLRARREVLIEMRLGQKVVPRSVAELRSSVAVKARVAQDSSVRETRCVTAAALVVAQRSSRKNSFDTMFQGGCVGAQPLAEGELRGKTRAAVPGSSSSVRGDSSVRERDGATAAALAVAQRSARKKGFTTLFQGVCVQGDTSLAVLGNSSSARASGVEPARHTLLRRKLCGLQLSEDIVDAVVGEMQVRVGEGLAWEFAESSWLSAWPRWEVFAEEVQVALQTWETDLAVMHVAPLISGLLFALFRYALQQKHMTVNTGDEGMLAELGAAGWVRRDGMVWGENDCLADSLLQLLIKRGVIPGDVDRQVACHANRAQLERTQDLLPRDLDGNVCLGGMLEHHRHAAPTVRFFLDFFGVRAVDLLPRAGINVVVHARYDDIEHPPDEVLLCAEVGRRAGGVWEFHLFNWTGVGFSGFHYDPLVRLAADVGGDPAQISDDSGGDAEVRGPELAPAVAIVAAAASDLGGGAPKHDDAVPRRRSMLRRHRTGLPDDPCVHGKAVAARPAVRVSQGVQDERAVDDLSRRVLRLAISADLPDPSLADLAVAGRVFGRGGSIGSLARSAAPAQVPRVGSSDEMLFDVAGVDAARCSARIFQQRRLDKAVFEQCSEGRKYGEFCGKHKAKRAQGVWDPPGHDSLPPAKLAEGRRAAQKRVAPLAVALQPPSGPALVAEVAPATGEHIGNTVVRSGATSLLKRPRGGCLGGAFRSALPEAPERRPRIVTGFGAERVEDVAADEARRIADGARRGAWHAGRR